jgi:hypothetical protein
LDGINKGLLDLDDIREGSLGLDGMDKAHLPWMASATLPQLRWHQGGSLHLDDIDKGSLSLDDINEPNFDQMAHLDWIASTRLA